MKLKTSTLTGPALDWAVAKCENEEVLICGPSVRSIWTNSLDPEELNYSTDWSQAGPIIERDFIDLGGDEYLSGQDHAWEATVMRNATGYVKHGPTPLIAAMRCFVASKLGDEVDVPEELL